MLISTTGDTYHAEAIINDNDGGVESVAVWVESVDGDPAPKGSFVQARRNSPALRNANPRTIHWEKRIFLVLKELFNQLPDFKLIDAPIELSCTFYLVKKKSNKAKQPFCEVVPDGDKLMRTLFDASQESVLFNDSRVVRWAGQKVYCNHEHPRPGVSFRLRVLSKCGADSIHGPIAMCLGV